MTVEPLRLFPDCTYAERHPGDFYETPEWCTRAILPHLGYSFRTVLDAGAGTGAIMRVVSRAVLDRFGTFANHYLQSVELDEARAKEANAHWGSFYNMHKLRGIGRGASSRKRAYDLVISNPPFSEAEKFAEHALTIGKTVCFLLRLGWLAANRDSKKDHILRRYQIHRKTPCDVYVLGRRPSFTTGETDSSEYAWFVWGKGRGNRWFLLDAP